MVDNIRVFFIFEILGTPADYIKKALEEFVNKLGQHKGITIINKKIHEPKECEKEGGKDLYTTFAEVEVSVENINLLFGIVHNMLPSNIEIFEPKEFYIKNFELTSILSDLVIKLHKYDEVAKVISIERKNLLDKIKELEEKIKELEGNNNIKKDSKKNQKEEIVNLCKS